MMSIEKQICFLGAGNMAGALIQGLLASRSCQPQQILASDVRPDRLNELKTAHGIQITNDNCYATAHCDVIILSTKPQVFPTLLKEIAESIRPESVVLSIAAGVPISVIQTHLGQQTRIVRAMPNTPALVQIGATGLAKGIRATDEDLCLAKQIFNSVGKTIVVEESLLDTVTGLSGSGPAYIFLVVESLIEAGVKLGLSREDSRTLAVQTLLGSATLLIKTGEEPAQLRSNVSSPRGTTVAGLQVLEAGRINDLFIQAVQKATERSRELGAEAANHLADS